ncbi:universal stress protein [Streptomyces sp. NPDC005435]|uniref:universal stress protein n=1 Tax=Streptomyces sp. NPDC005435 TaxID=3154464 RepID=UPI0034526219
MVGFDGSYPARAALRWAARQARERRAVLDIVTVWEEGAANIPLAEAPLDLARERLGAALTTLVRERNTPRRIVTAPLRGLPGEELVRRAEDADLLILGSGEDPDAPGPLTRHCLRRSATPVVLVPASSA